MSLLQTFILVVSIISALISILTFIRGADKLESQTFRIVLSVITVISTICVVTFIFISHQSVAVPNPIYNTPTITASANFTSLESVWLDDLIPVLPNKKAFFINKWNEYSGICINNISYVHGIGLKIPSDTLAEMVTEQSPKSDSVEVSEYSEYALRLDYKSICFTIGVDQSSFVASKNEAPECICRIVLTSEKGIVLYDSGLFDYSFSENLNVVDLSTVETLRITAYWAFDRDPTKQNALNLAIVDPILYLKES